MTRPNFRIVEEPVDTFPYTDFIRDYNNLEYSYRDLMKMYDLSMSEYTNLIQRLSKQGLKVRGIGEDRIGTHQHYQAKYYYCSPSTGYYHIKRWFDGKYRWFGSFRCREDCMRRLEELEANNWEGYIKGDDK